MPTSYTSLLGLALPVTGELSGTWGDTVNSYITQYVDAAVEGTQTISGSQTAVTLSTANGTALSQAGSGATGSAQYAVINCTGNPASLLTITVPASSRNYIVINSTSTSQSVKIVGVGPTTGVTLVSGEKAIVVWNGSDFIKTASTVITNLTGTLPVANGGTGTTSLTANNVILGNGTSAVQFVAPGTNGNVLTSNGTTWTSAVLPAGGLTYIFTTTPITLTDKQGALTDTSGGSFTVTLPASPSTGAQVVVADAGSNWGTNNLTVGRNGSTIGGLAQDLVCDITGASVQLVYDGTTWEVYAQIGGNGGNAATQPGNNAFTGANTFYNATGQTFGTATAAQDGIILTGRAGGTSTFRVTFTPGTLSSNRTLTLPDASGTILQSGTTVTVPQGGTGATTLTGVVKGNGTSAFTAGTVSLTSEVAGTLPVANGGTGVSTLTSNNVILGNGTSAVQFVAPGTAGNVLTSNGTTWTSATAGGGGAQPFVTMVGPGDNGVISFQPASNNFGII